GNRAADHRHSAWRAGRGSAPGGVCRIAGAVERGSVAGSQSGLGSGATHCTRGVRANNGGSARTSSLHRQEVGRGRQEKEIGTEVMKTLVTAIQKGGQGKTFATCHLAFDFQERGLRVAVIDLDTQGNASFTLAAHQSGYLSSQLFSGDDEGL